jgi:uncharacterized membrane protein
MDNTSQRYPAVIAYLFPVIGWLYVYLFQRTNPFARFHLKQAIGLCLGILAAFVAWVVVAWILVWIPYGSVFSAALFTLVMAALLAGFFFWIGAMINAARGQVAYVPLVGEAANRLPF